MTELTKGELTKGELTKGELTKGELTKGELTKREILNRVNDLYNEYGVLLTLSEIAAKTKLGRSRITNYYPKKENLIIGLLNQYEEELAILAKKYSSTDTISDLKEYTVYLSDIMDMMFQYRGVMSHVLVNPIPDCDISGQLHKNYKRNINRIKSRIETFVSNGLVSPILLEKENLEIYIFQFLCLTSTWMIMYNQLDAGKELSKVKPRYLRGVLFGIKPYLTKKGEANLAEAFEELDKG
jgi:AcrR family transcriptional regulator